MQCSLHVKRIVSLPQYKDPREAETRPAGLSAIGNALGALDFTRPVLDRPPACRAGHT